MGIRGAISAYRGLINNLKEGEVATNAARIFHMIQKNGTDAMAAMREATMGVMSDTSIQHLGNQMKLLGAATEQQSEIMRLATLNFLATNKPIQSTAERLINAVIMGEESSLKMLGVNIDLKKAVEEAADAQGKQVAQLEKTELMYIRLQVVMESLKDTFKDIDFSKMALNVHEMDTATANLVSQLQELGAAAFNAGKGTLTLAKAQTTATATARAHLGQLHDLAFGEKMIKGSKIATSAIQAMGDGMTKTATENMDTLRAAMSQMGGAGGNRWLQLMQQEFNTASGQVRDHQAMLEIFANFQKDLEKKEGVRVKTKAKETRDTLAEIQSQIETDAILADAAADRADARDAKRNADKITRLKNGGAATADMTGRIASINLAHMEMMDRQDGAAVAEKRRWEREMVSIWDELADHTSARMKAITVGHHAHKEKLAEIDAAALEKTLARDQRFAQLNADLRKSQLAADDEEGRARMDRHISRMQLKHDLDSGEITATEYHLQTLIDVNRRHNEQERELLEERQRYREEAAQAAADMNSEVLSLARTQKDDVATALSTVGQSAAILGRNWEDLRKGAPATISAMSGVITSGIRDERTLAKTRGLMAAAQSLYYFGMLNPVQGTAMALAAAAFFKVSGGGGGGGGSARSGAVVGAGGGGETLGEITGAATTTVVNVTGFVGSNTGLASDISRAQREANAAGFSDSDTF